MYGIIELPKVIAFLNIMQLELKDSCHRNFKLIFHSLITVIHFDND